MSANISEQTIIESLHQIPVERWDEVLDFLGTLREAQSPIRTAADLIESEVIGLWADRTDIGDNHEFARRLRHEAESRHGADDAVGQ